MDSRHVAQVGHIRVAVSEDGGREVRPALVLVFVVELAVPRGLPAERLPRHGRRLYFRAHRPKSHSRMVRWTLVSVKHLRVQACVNG
jgi:hypothetical protein